MSTCAMRFAHISYTQEHAVPYLVKSKACSPVLVSRRGCATPRSCRDAVFGPLAFGDEELAFEHLDVEALARHMFDIGALANNRKVSH